MLRRISLVAFLLCVVLGSLPAATPVLYMMTKPLPSGCDARPTPYSTFSPTDPVAYLWFYVTGVNQGDVFASSYYTPSGQFYAPPSGPWDPRPSGGDWCLTDAPFYIAGQAPASLPGIWTVKVTLNGQPFFSLTFNIGGPPPVTYAMTKPQSPEPLNLCANPTPPATAFSSTDSSAVLWFDVTGPNAGDVYAVNYYEPSGTLYSAATYTWSPVSSGANSECFINYFNIAGYTPASTPGTWTATVTDNSSTVFSTTFTISGITPTISSVSPPSATAGGPAFTLTVNGAGFVPGAAVEWNGSPLQTSYVSAIQLTASVPAYLIASPGSANVTVLDPGGAPSKAVAIPIGSVLSRSGVLAHIAAGGGWWTTVISLFNTSASPVSVTVALHADDGSALSLPLTITAQGATQTLTTSSPSAVINPNSTVLITIGNGISNVTQGWADVLSSGPVNGFAIFRSVGSSSPVSEGTVPLQTQFPTRILLPYDNTAGALTAVAIANLATVSANVTATIWDQDGNLLGTQIIGLQPSGHQAFVLTDQIPAAASRLGIVQFQTNASAGLTALGLRFDPYGAFTSIPTVLLP